MIYLSGKSFAAFLDSRLVEIEYEVEVNSKKRSRQHVKGFMYNSRLITGISHNTLSAYLRKWRSGEVDVSLDMADRTLIECGMLLAEFEQWAKAKRKKVEVKK